MANPDLPRRSYLANQRIDDNGPGSVLADFEALLGFVGDGVRSTGKYHLLPMARLFDHPCIDDADRRTDEMTIGELPLNERQSMIFHYDFGADWRFNVQLERIEPESAKISKPTIVESRGEAPPEYEYDDEW